MPCSGACRKNGRPVGWLFGLYLVFAGVERFLVEILRAKDDRLLGPFTLAQLTSVIIVVHRTRTDIRLAARPEPGAGSLFVDWEESASDQSFDSFVTG